MVEDVTDYLDVGGLAESDGDSGVAAKCRARCWVAGGTDGAVWVLLVAEDEM